MGKFRHKAHANDCRSSGFTALEVLITMAVAAILLIIGVPALSEFGSRQRMDASVTSLHTQLALARSDAIHFNTHIIVCPGDPDRGCLASGHWDNGWMAFSDLNGDREHQSLEPVHRIEAGFEQVSIRSTTGRSKLRFYPNGSAPGSNGSITFCDRRGPASARKLVISNMGRIRRDDAPETRLENCPDQAG